MSVHYKIYLSETNISKFSNLTINSAKLQKYYKPPKFDSTNNMHII